MVLDASGAKPLTTRHPVYIEKNRLQVHSIDKIASAFHLALKISSIPTGKLVEIYSRHIVLCLGHFSNIVFS